MFFISASFSYLCIFPFCVFSLCIFFRYKVYSHGAEFVMEGVLFVQAEVLMIPPRRWNKNTDVRKRRELTREESGAEGKRSRQFPHITLRVGILEIIFKKRHMQFRSKIDHSLYRIMLYPKKQQMICGRKWWVPTSFRHQFYGETIKRRATCTPNQILLFGQNEKFCLLKIFRLNI